jgi:signal recognition particle receptor subunit beta
MLELTKTTGLPTVIAANKADLKGALSPAEIRAIMKLPTEYPVIPVAAENYKEAKPGEPCKLKREDVGKVLKKLLERVV